MELKVCFAQPNDGDIVLTLPVGKVTVPAGKGMWLDFEPGFELPTSEFPDDVLNVVRRVKLPDGIVGLRVVTSSELWTFYAHPTYGLVPRLELEAGAVVEKWPTLTELGGPWVVSHVLPDGNLLPLCYVEPVHGFVVGDNKRKVNLPGGYMALTPTTVRQWNWYCADTGKTPKATTVALKGFNYGLLDHPVTEVSYWEACDFAKWAGVGLPSEEQWEHAARGNDGRKFPWGNDAPTDELCHSSVNVQKDRTDTVFNRPKGASPYGCLDMSGNVWEWTSTVHK